MALLSSKLNKLAAVSAIYKIAGESVEVVGANRSIFIYILRMVSVTAMSFK